MPVLMMHAGHQRRHVAGRDRMRRRQPDVQGHDARLDAKAEQEKQKRGITVFRRHSFAERVEAVEAVPSRILEQQQEAQNQTARADMRHDEKENARLARLRLFMLKTNEAEGGQRHQFPGDEEDPDVGRHEEQRRGQQHPVVERPSTPAFLRPK